MTLLPVGLTFAMLALSNGGDSPATREPVVVRAAGPLSYHSHIDGQAWVTMVTWEDVAPTLSWSYWAPLPKRLEHGRVHLVVLMSGQAVTPAEQER